MTTSLPRHLRLPVRPPAARGLLGLLAAALATALGAGSAPASVKLLDESPAGVRLAWAIPASGATPEHVRLVVPPGMAPQVEGDVPAAAGVHVVASGWRGLLPLTTLRLDPLGLLPGTHEVVLRWAPAAPSGLPPGLRPVPAEVASGALPAEADGVLAGGPAGVLAGGPAGVLAGGPAGFLANESASLRDAPLLNPDAAPAAEELALRQPALRPAAAPMQPHGTGLPARQAAGPSGVRPMSFTSGRAKIVVDPGAPGRPGGPGLYRITHAMLGSVGIVPDAERMADLRLLTIDTTTSLVGQVLVPLRRHDANGDGLFGPGDWVEFWGEPMLGEDFPTEYQRGDFTDARGYLLDLHPAAPSPEIAADLDGTPVSPETPDFLDTARAERNDMFINTSRTGAAGVDHFYWCSPQRLSWTSSPGTEARRTESIDLPGLAAGSARTGAVRVRLLHRNGDVAPSPDHRSLVDVGTRIGASDRTGDGYQVVDHEVTGLVAGTDLLATTAVTMRAPGVPGVAANLFELNFIEADYPRTFDLADGRLVLGHEPGWSVTARGLSGPDVTVLDVTDPLAPRVAGGIVVSAGTARFELSGDGSGETVRYAVQETPDGEPALRPAALELFEDPGLRRSDVECDVLVLSPRAWVQPEPAALARWRALRQAEGLAVRVVAMEDVLDEFGTGSFTPVAIAGLLSTALSTWARPPAYVLLLGDASVDYKNGMDGRVLDPSTCTPTNDPCGFDETAWVQHAPTRILDRAADVLFLGWYASDVLQTLVAGNDWYPDVALGRLPARSAAEAAALLDKAVDYEEFAETRPPWTGRVMMVADQIETPQEQAFETYQTAARDAHVHPPHVTAQHYYQRDWGGEPPGPFTQDLLDAWRDPSRSAAVMSYVGHGSAFRWSSDDLLTNRGLSPCRNDVDLLTQPGVPQPLLLNANCITGTFVAPLGPSLLEELVRAPEGGAIGAYGPTGVTDLTEAVDVLNAAFSLSHGRDGRVGRAGDIVRRIQESLAVSAIVDPVPLLGNAYLGDPSLTPAVARGPSALGLVAVPGDARVDLSWPAVPGAATYALYRTGSSPTGTYELVAADLTGTTHADAGDPPGPADAVVNNQLYHYALEPRDADGFPGRWSARVAARPCTLDAPEPATAVIVTPGACTGSFTLRFTASATPGLQGYRIRAYRGLQATGVPERVSFAPGTFASVAGLVRWRDYTFTVSSLTWCGAEGAPTSPVTARSECPLAVDVPAHVTDLRMSRQGSDLALQWSPITTTVRGSAARIVSYRVHRSPEVDFLAGPGTTISDAAPTTHVDAGRVGAGASLEFYAVAAVDDADRWGGVGHDLPQGARNMSTRDLGTEREVIWTPVLHDIRGQITPIAGYEIYESDAPLSRARIEAEGLLPVATVPEPPALIPTRPAATSWFVVPVDVHGNRSAD